MINRKHVFQTQLTRSQIEEKVKQFPKSKLRLMPAHLWHYSKVAGDVIKATSIISVVKGTIKEMDSGCEIELTSRLRYVLYFCFMFALSNIPLILFGDDVTLNGNADPSVASKVGFALIWCLIVAIPTLIVVKLKRVFVQMIKERLELNEMGI